jgi:hypothetical protein
VDAFVAAFDLDEPIHEGAHFGLSARRPVGVGEQTGNFCHKAKGKAVRNCRQCVNAWGTGQLVFITERSIEIWIYLIGKIRAFLHSNIEY